jgi:hypothetical protein
MLLLNDVIMPLLEPILELVEALLPAIEPLLKVIVEALKPGLDLLTMLADVLGTVVGWISDIVGWVAQGLTWVVDLVFGGSSGDISMDGYATGGFTNGLSIAGEDPRYPTEAVLSFNPAYRSQNLAYWAQAGRMLGADETDFALGGSGGGTTIDFGGVTFAPQIEINGQADKQSIMEAIEDEYPEFIDMLEAWLAGRGKPVYG